MNSRIENDLKRNGVYFTFLVKELVNFLVKINKPASVKDIMMFFRKKQFFPYYSTLYRQLERLKDINVIKEIIFTDGVKRYYFCNKSDTYIFFRCSKCKEIKVTTLKNKLVLKEMAKNGVQLMITEDICKKCNG